jgi:uncharacterized protein YndB with AHSA1/START domain
MRKPEFVYVSYIETTPEKLWEALTSSEFTRRYWFDTEVRSDWKVGSPFALAMGGKVTDTGDILESDRPRRLSYSFKHELFEEMRQEPVTKVVFTIDPFDAIVKLTVTHEGFVEGGKLLGSISKGWPAILSGLKSLLEIGRAVVIPHSASRDSTDDETLPKGSARHGHHEIQTRDRLHHLHRIHDREGVAGADIGGVQPEIFLRQFGRSRSQDRRRLYRAHARRCAAYQGRGDRMQTFAEIDRHLQRQLAGAGREARSHARHLRD